MNVFSSSKTHDDVCKVGMKMKLGSMVDMMKILFFVLRLLYSYDCYRFHAIHIDDLEIETQLQVINKPSFQVHIFLLFRIIL